MVFSCYAILRNVGDKGKETSGSEMLKERDVEVVCDRCRSGGEKGLLPSCAWPCCLTRYMAPMSDEPTAVSRVRCARASLLLALLD